MAPYLPAYTLIRSKRKTIGLHVQPDGGLVVRAPLRTRLATIEQVIADRLDWIHKAQSRARESYAPHHFASGEAFWFLGKTYPLAITTHSGQALVFDGRRFVLSAKTLPVAREAFVGWYRRQARQVISERVACLAALHGFAPARVRITSARTRWGSCSARGALSFPWRLVMAPPEVIDYVILHELAHLRVHNHSKAFWALAAGLCPGYKKQIAWLKQHGRLLELG